MVGIDIGSAKVCVAVGKRCSHGAIEILGIGRAVSAGVTKKGMEDFEAASRCVREALMDAESKSRVKIRSAVLAVSGIKDPTDFPLEPQNFVEIKRNSYFIQSGDVRLPMKLPFRERSEDCQFVCSPSVRLENNVRCLKALGIEVKRVVYGPVASAAAVLSADQRACGGLVIDIGEARTQYAAYVDGVLVQSDSIPWGVQDIIPYLSAALHPPLECSGRLTIGQNLALPVDPELGVNHVLNNAAGTVVREIDPDMLRAIVFSRMGAILDLVGIRLEARGLDFKSLGSGVHLVGGGALLPWISFLAQLLFGVPENLVFVHDIPQESARLTDDPRYACAIGLVKTQPEANELVQ